MVLSSKLSMVLVNVLAMMLSMVLARHW